MRSPMATPPGCMRSSAGCALATFPITRCSRRAGIAAPRISIATLQTDLSTVRCDLHPVSAADAGALHALWTSGAVRRYLWDDEIISRERTDDAVASSERLFEENDFGLWVVRDRFDKSL